MVKSGEGNVKELQEDYYKRASDYQKKKKKHNHYHQKTNKQCNSEKTQTHAFRITEVSLHLAVQIKHVATPPPLPDRLAGGGLWFSMHHSTVLLGLCGNLGDGISQEA